MFLNEPSGCLIAGRVTILSRCGTASGQKTHRKFRADAKPTTHIAFFSMFKTGSGSSNATSLMMAKRITFISNNASRYPIYQLTSVSNSLRLGPTIGSKKCLRMLEGQQGTSKLRKRHREPRKSVAPVWYRPAIGQGYQTGSDRNISF